MPDMERLYDALRKADAAGNTADAKRLADYIREQQAQPAEAAAATDVGAPETVFRGVTEGGTFNFASEIKAASGAGMYAVAKGVRSLLPGGVPEDVASVGDVYRTIRDEDEARTAEVAEARPYLYNTSAVGGVLATSGVNPVSVGRAGVRSLLALGTREAYTAAAGRALLTQGAKGAVGGAGYGAVAGAGASEADLTEGQYGEFFEDVLEGGATGAKYGAGAGGLLGAGSRASALRAESAAAAKAAEREQALLKTGLEGRQKTLGGAKRAKERAQALYDEPSPQDPRKTLLEQVEKASPDERLEYATRLRQQTGKELGAIRDELSKVEGAGVSAEVVKQQFRGAVAELPTEVQAKALEQLDGMVGAVAKEGFVPPAQLRKLVEDVEAFAKFGTPNLEAALGNARARVFQAARGVLVGNERELIAKALPERAEQYSEALRKYSVYSDFELGSKVMLERANKGQAPVRQPSSSAKEPSTGRQLLRLALGEDRVRAAETIAQIWRRWRTPTTAQLKKLERLQPMMEEALAKGPAEVARIHALFMQRSPDYRKAVEAGE